jgi:uncharacterized protein YprB with RNaseH-like and TPR domain
LIKKKPTGALWEEFIRTWGISNHEEKLNLCRAFHVGYDTARHWISDSGEAKPEEPRMTLTGPELLATRPSVNMDFLFLDLETSNLQADFSVILTACLKPYGAAPIVFRSDEYPTWEKHRSDDSAITKDISDELRKHAVVVGHYSSGFDVPFLRAKMVKHNLPPLPPMFGVDTWRIAKNNFQVSSRRLQTLSRFFDLGDKEPVEGPLWLKAAYDGDKDAMDKVVAHNIQDVLLLEKLTCLTFPYIRMISKL